jgi:hypothetical protein
MEANSAFIEPQYALDQSVRLIQKGQNVLGIKPEALASKDLSEN